MGMAWPARRSSDGETRGARGAGRLSGSLRPRAPNNCSHMQKNIILVRTLVRKMTQFFYFSIFK